MKLLGHPFVACVPLLTAAALSGCGVNQFPGTASTGSSVSITVAPVASIQGHVESGSSPVAGVTVQLYAAGASGYGSAYPYANGVSLLGANAVSTDSSGNFKLTGMYTCPSTATLVYLVGTHGSVIAGQPANPNLGMLAALGPCGNLTNMTSITVNELTTVASVWALAPFMKGIANVGTSATNQVGLANAFAAVNKLVDTRTAVIPGPVLPSGATLPVAEINTLADILETCIDSAGGSAGDGSACGTLFALTKNTSGVAPTDTLTAALNIAQNPVQNVTALNLLPNGKASYQPTLGNIPPAAWTLAIRYTAANTLSAPAGIAADQSGSVWITNKASSTITRLDNSGAVLSGTLGYAGGQVGEGTIAIDASGNAWAAANTPGAVLRITPSGAASTFTGGGLTNTTSIAIDGQGQIWAAGTGNDLSGFTSAGVPISANGFNGGGLSSAQAIAIGH